ncbi:MAG: DNA gyrase subunit A [bacterium]|nr:DNA gyrase subunit A [bacterium]
MSPQDTQNNIGRVENVSIVDEMERSYLDYAMSVIVARALPDARDGLKPVHRRIIFAMHGMGMSHSSRYTKSAKVVGEVLGKYHPHGDMPVYDALVRMAQTFSMREMLIDGQGNFGSVDGDRAAAMRYTECRLSGICGKLLTDIEKNTVGFTPNFDGTLEEPVVLPAVFPNLLTNGASGIAVGMATNIPPHNLGEVIDATIFLIQRGMIQNNTFGSEMDPAELSTIIKGPDFPTGAIIYNAKDISAAHATGKGRIVMRARTEIEEGKGGKFRILVTEIPYQVNKATLVIRIADLVKEKKIEGISDLRDESDRRGMQIVIELKRDANPKAVLNRLFKYTAMQTVFNVNMVALDKGTPKIMHLKQLLEAFINHRIVIITRRSVFELEAAKARLHILEGLKIALEFLDEVISTIRKSKDADEAKTALIKKFGLTEIQAVAILDMQLRKLAALERQKIEDEYAVLKMTIVRLEDLLAHKEKMLGVITEELTAVKETFATPRKTLVVRGTVGEFSEDDLVAKETTVITITVGGYIKRQPPSTFRTQHRGGKGVTGIHTKEEDTVMQLLTANTHDDILFFTNRGRVFRVRAYEIPEGSRIAKGAAIVNFILLDAGEQVTSMLATNPQHAGKAFAFMATKAGTVKKTLVDEYGNIRRSGMIAIKLSPGDELRWVRHTGGSDDVLMVTRNGQSIRFSEMDVRPTARDTMGVRGILLGKGDVVIGVDLIDEEKGTFLSIMERGLGKRTDIHQWALQGRGGRGVKAAQMSAKTGPVVGAFFVRPKIKTVILTSKRGQVIKLPIESVPLLGRQTQGVILMRLPQNDSISAVTPLELEVEVVDEKGT